MNGSIRSTNFLNMALISTWLTSLSVRNIYWQNYLVSEVHGSMNEGLCEDDYSTALYSEFRTFHGFNGDRNSQTFRPWLSLWGGQTNQRETTHPNINKTHVNTQRPLFRGFPEHLLIMGTGDSRESDANSDTWSLRGCHTRRLCSSSRCHGNAPMETLVSRATWAGLASRLWFSMYEDGKKCWITYRNETSDSVWHPLTIKRSDFILFPASLCTFYGIIITLNNAFIFILHCLHFYLHFIAMERFPCAFQNCKL